MWVFVRILILAIAGLVSVVFAQSDENIFVGVRPLSLGGAFTAVADDANAMFYNPAGLRFIKQHEAAFMNADLFGTGVQTTYFSYALPINRRMAVGMDWQHVGFGDGELGYNRDIVKGAFSSQLYNSVSVGINVKYLFTNMLLDGQSVGKGAGLGGDVGLLVSLTNRLRLGVNVHDVTGTGVTYTGGGSATLLPRSVRAGVAWEAGKDLLLAMDLGRKVHMGGEYWVTDQLVLRGGVQKDLKTSDPFELNLGLGLRYKAFQIDLAHAPGKRGLGQTQRYGLTMTFDPVSSAVQIAEIEGEDLFASYYQAYGSRFMGHILLENKSDQSLECRLMVSAPDYEEVPYEETLIIRKGDRAQRVPFRLLLSDKVLDVSKDTAIPVQVRVEYTTGARTRSDQKSGRMVLYGRGALLWDDIGRAAAFVNSRDQGVETFARHVSRTVSEFVHFRQVERNVLQAGAVFEALRRYGIRYQVDPNNPYAEVVGADWPFDNIQYPRELLRRRTGDCDDCTVLFCSLLENLGIATGVVDVPGHIFAVFDVGVDPAQIYKLGIPADRLLRFKDRFWVPVETTLWGKSFEEVWDAGLRQLRDLPDWEDRIQVVSEAWRTYPPSQPSFDFAIEEKVVSLACDSALVATRIESLNRLKRMFVDQEYGQILETNAKDPELHFEVAYVYMSLNMLADARAEVKKAAQLSTDAVRVETYMGNTYFLENDLQKAVGHYERAFEMDPDDLGLKENLERAMKRLVSEIDSDIQNQ